PTTLPPPAPSSAHFVVWGENPLALRLVEMLLTQYERSVVAMIRPGPNRWGQLIRELPGVEVITAEHLDRAAFAAARLEEAEALAIVDQDDAANVEAALLAQEISPDLRIVIRMAKQSLGERMSALLPNCTALSASAIAAPAFVAAAIGVAATPPIEVGDRPVVGILRERTRPEDVLAGLAVMGPRGTVPEFLPADADTRADLVLARSKPAPPPRPPRSWPAGLVLSLLFGRRMRAVIAVFLVLYALGTAALFLSQPGRSITDAAYSALITALSGNPDEGVTGVARIAVVALTIVSLALIPAITATIVDALVKLRLQREAGGLYDPIAEHTVVVGLGDVGTRIVRALRDQGIEVVAVERDGARPGVQVARDLKIPVIVGDASRPETLERASIATAQTLIVASTDDVTNLEIALLGRAARPDLRVVLRLFDSEFADRVRRAFNIHVSRSVSYLAAPAFAAAMIGRAVLATIPVRRRVLLLAEVPVGERSLLEHMTVAVANRPYESRLLAVRTADQVVWRPSDSRPLRAGDGIIVVATRVGLSRLLAESTAGSAAGPATPYRLLQSWEITVPGQQIPGHRTPDAQPTQP
ncbi:MAG: NAD-binding protein, partial [Micromonosporaceae bacterium]|nr:NAD-binding protein [Micromonosporaceae bacterium]